MNFDKLSLTTEYRGIRKEDNWEHYLWRANIIGVGDSMSVRFRCGMAWVEDGEPKPPTLEDVIHSIVSDALCVADQDGLPFIEQQPGRWHTFESFVEDMGYDIEDSRELSRVANIYSACCKQTIAFLAFLRGQDMLKDLDAICEYFINY